MISTMYVHKEKQTCCTSKEWEQRGEKHIKKKRKTSKCTQKPLISPLQREIFYGASSFEIKSKCMLTYLHTLIMRYCLFCKKKRKKNTKKGKRNNWYLRIMYGNLTCVTHTLSSLLLLLVQCCGCITLLC